MGLDRSLTLSRLVVGLLAELFHQLEVNKSAAVTPNLDLAKLALVTSKDEEENDGDQGGTDSSHSTDATLVDENATAVHESSQPRSYSNTSIISKSVSPPPLSRSPSSVLGKRTRRECRGDDDAMIMDGAFTEATFEQDGFVLVSEPSSPSGLESKPSGSDTPVTIEDEGDVEMAGPIAGEVPKAPPLPPRPKVASSSEMMFGRIGFLF